MKRVGRYRSRRAPNHERDRSERFNFKDRGGHPAPLLNVTGKV